MEMQWRKMRGFGHLVIGPEVTGGEGVRLQERITFATSYRKENAAVIRQTPSKRGGGSNGVVIGRPQTGSSNG
jgi:hypothetical protein